ncbi:MAG: class A beta-lactamase [Gemmatimonadales bacterium]
MPTAFLARVALVALGLGLCAPAAAIAQGQRVLLEEIRRIEPISGGTLGIAAVHLETGRSFSYQADQQYPLASTYKVPIAIQAFKLVEEGKLDLDRMITIEPSDIHIGSEFNNLFQARGVALSVRVLIEDMLIFSENSATDKVLELAGGGEQVTARLRAFGIQQLRVDRATADIIANPYGITDIWTQNGKFSKEAWERAIAAVPPARRDSAGWYYGRDPRDHGSPTAMLQILTRLWKGELLSKANRDYMLDIMYRCETGAARIKGMLPAGTRVAHKTGTYPSTANDVGIIDLPDGTHLAIAVMVKGSTKETPALEQAIAHASRAIYDAALFGAL